ncbi:hypothetical protein BDV96DRAFT_688046 [Lophiotrema nucula]|uniref:F-box domain-containing protein n=1 Tax=Lophiotrema nucula TaxID=690887 RepID=A0A6A5Z517_9PLEO|nr:hypothetical protein BDV96DRAFT_688046 [Lophiotrema nucula]
MVKMAAQSTLETLPDELLLNITSSLPTPGLKEFCLVSGKVRPIVQDVLYRDINVRGFGHYHPGVNRMMSLLGTLLSRPDLALKVDSLCFRTVRKNFRKQYEDHAFDFAGLQEMCLGRLKELGHGEGDPWHTMFKASIESAFAGLLLALVPNLATLDLAIFDNHHGLFAYEPLVALFGTPMPAKAALPTFRHLRHLSIPSVHLPLLALDLQNLTKLEMDKMTTIQMSRLNGPNSLAGASKLKKLKLEAVVQLMEVDHIEACYITFADLLAALGNPALTSLDVHFFSEACPHGSAKLDMSRFMQELESVSTSLEELKFWLRYDCMHGDCEWILDNVRAPATSLKHFTALKTLTLPDNFLFARSIECESIAEIIPPNLEALEIIYPSAASMDLLKHLADERQSGKFAALDKVSLVCCDQYNLPAEYFWNHDVPNAREASFSVIAYCQEQDLYAPLGCGEDDASSDDDDDDDDDDDLDELPDLEELDGVETVRHHSIEDIEVAEMD